MTVNLQHSHASRIASSIQVSQTHDNLIIHKLLCRNRFGKDISHHSLSVAVSKLHFFLSNTLTNKMLNNINVLRPDLRQLVVTDSDAALIITPHVDSTC